MHDPRDRVDWVDLTEEAPEAPPRRWRVRPFAEAGWVFAIGIAVCPWSDGVRHSVHVALGPIVIGMEWWRD